MFFLILVCTFYSTKKLIGEVIGNIKFEDEKADYHFMKDISTVLQERRVTGQPLRPARPDRRNGEMITIIISAIISAITAKIVATYYFEKADCYVKEMC